MPGRKVDPEKVATYALAISQGATISQAILQSGISRQTAYRQLDDPSSEINKALAKLGLAAGKIPTAKELTKQARQALDDFGFFRDFFFGRSTSPWAEDAAMKIVELLETDRKEYVVVNIAPGTGKSTFFTHDLPAWILCRDRAKSIMIGSLSQNMANSYVNQLRVTFERSIPELADPDLVEMGMAKEPLSTLALSYGRFKPQGGLGQWSRNQFDIAQPNGQPRGKKEPSVAGYGMDSGFLGGRFDFAIWDDVVDNDSFATESAQKRMILNWKNLAETRINPKGLIILQGQRLSPNDLYRYCLDLKEATEIDGERVETSSKKYTHIVYKAHYEEKCMAKEYPETHALYAKPWPEGCLLDPYRLAWRELANMQLNDENTYRTVFQQEDVGQGDKLVKKIWVDGGLDPETNTYFPGCYDDDRSSGIVDPMLKGVSIITADPSPTQYWSCVDVDALVATDKGDKRLGDIQAGEKVLTRAGYKEVLKSGSRGFKQTINLNLDNGTTLSVTPDHRIATTEGWVEAGKLLTGASLIVRSQSSLSGTSAATPFSFVSNVKILSAKRMPLRTGISFGKSADVLRSPHIFSMILKNQMLKPHARRFSAKMASFFTFGNRVTVKEKMSQDNSGNNNFSLILKETRSRVAATIFRTVPNPATVVINGDTLLDPFDTKWDALFNRNPTITASNASSRFDPDLNSAISASSLVSITHGSIIETWDLTVKDAPEFFANEVLVHNCIWWVYNPETKFQHLIEMKREPMTASDFLDFNPDSGRFTGLLETWWQESFAQGRPITTLIVEENAAQRFMLQYNHFRRWAILRKVNLVSHQTGRNKSDAKFGVQTIGPYYKFGQIRLPGNKLDGSRHSVSQLVKEVTEWPGGVTDDCVMSHWFLVWNAQNLFPTANLEPIKFPGVPSWAEGEF